MKTDDNKSIPLVRIGQGEYGRDYYPDDFEEPPNPNEGQSIGMVILFLLYFVAGVLIGAWIW